MTIANRLKLTLKHLPKAAGWVCCSLFFAFALVLSSSVQANETQKALAQDSERASQLSAKYEKFYDLLNEHEDIRDITEAVLQSPDVDKKAKDVIRRYNRKIYLFKYPSDGLKIKAILSFSPASKKENLLIFLRGGNKKFGIPSPAYVFNSYKDYPIITVLYRDGVNEGKDEFGGADLKDVKNLVEFIPKLSTLLNEKFHSKKIFLLGGGRGGLELFLALSRFPSLQAQVNKVVSLSGFYNLERTIQERPSMNVMFQRDFNLTQANKREWFAKRNALSAVRNIRKDLPILIIHGTQDIRHSVNESRDMVSQLLSNGNKVSYWEVEGEGNGLRNRSNKMDRIMEWFETGL